MDMPRRPYLTTRAHQVFALAHDLADRRGDVGLTPAHLVLGLLAEGRGIAVHVLHVRGVPLDALARELEAALPAPGAPRTAPAPRQWTPEDERIIDACVHEARELGTEYYGAEHLLLALLRDPAGVPARLLAPHGVAFDEVHAEVRRVMAPSAEVPPPSTAG